MPVRPPCRSRGFGKLDGHLLGGGMAIYLPVTATGVIEKSRNKTLAPVVILIFIELLSGNPDRIKYQCVANNNWTIKKDTRWTNRTVLLIVISTKSKTIFGKKYWEFSKNFSNKMWCEKIREFLLLAKSFHRKNV